MIPPFCVFAASEMVSRPFARSNAFFPHVIVWNEPKDKEVHAAGHPEGAKHLIGRPMADGFDMAYAYTLRHEIGLAHAFINTLLYLDYDRQGFPYPVVPFPVNCYGSAIVRNRGGIGTSSSAAPDPPGPTPARCFALGASTARAFAAGPWGVALIASSSLVPRLSDASYGIPLPRHRGRSSTLHRAARRPSRSVAGPVAERDGGGRPARAPQLDLSRGGMHELGRRVEIVDWVEAYVFNSSKCFAVFRPGA